MKLKLINILAIIIAFNYLTIANANASQTTPIKRVDFIDQGTIDTVGAKEVTVKKFSFNKDHNTYVLILEDGTKVELSESVKFIIY